jgi:hypothetical protein
MRTKNDIKFIQTRQYNFSNKLALDNILPPNIDFEENRLKNLKDK